MTSKPESSRPVFFLKQTFGLQGGLEKYCLLLANHFSEEGLDVTIATLSPLPADVLKYRWHWTCLSKMRIKISFIRMILFDLLVQKYIRKSHVKPILFGFDRHFLTLDIYRAGNGCHKAYLERRRKESSYIKKILLYLNPLHWCTLLSEKKTYEWSQTQIICNSQLVRSEIERCYPKVAKERLNVIHNGVDWVQLEPLFQESLHHKKEIQQQFSVPRDAIHIVLVGNEWYRKGVDIFIKALYLVQKELSKNNIPFFVTIAGKERKPEKFIKMAEDCALQQYIQFFPNTVSTLKLFQSADICVIPSRYDPFANITVEALAMGLWTVSTKENGGSEVIQHGKNGFIAQNCRESEIAKGIIQGIEHLIRLIVTKENIRMSVQSLDIRNTLSVYANLVHNIK